MPKSHQASSEPVEKLIPLDLRIPKWDPKKIEDRVCPFCFTDSNSVEYLRPDGLGVKRCKCCKTLFISPAPNSAALEEFYSSYHTQHAGVNRETPEEVLSILKGTDPLGDVRIQVISSLLDIEKSRVLDIGCGKGQFLFQLKKLGANVVGVEIDKDAVSFAKQLGINSIHTGSVESYGGENKFDLITLNDLIEHPLNPLELLRKSMELLRPGGFLLIWTPNGNRPDVDSKKITLRVDLEHLQYLGSGTIKYIIKALPLEIVHYETLGYSSFEDITNRMPGKTKRLMVFAKNLIKKTPGFLLVNRVKQKFLISYKTRLGNYHLFCIFKKID